MSESGIPGNAGATILAIDDDRDITETIKGNLELDGYEVLCAFDGRTGLDMAKSHRPDLILLDLNLPDLDGIRVCQIMRRESEIPIIILTSRNEISDKVLGLECGADDYVVKPFSFLELSARIRTILKRFERSLIRNQYDIKDFSLDYKSGRVTVREKKVRLTRTEFRLLELFVSFPDEVLSRKYIMNQIWKDSQLYQHSRTVDVHIQRLRKKIEKDTENPRYIVTVPGVGYKFRG
ncbi:MAG: DNA-binding response regulator [Desulfobacteraceae bacterium 4572_88]|nr:MAG: DNA-binding response regulator [Desulfobacteraceae bacterium 4572_88]